MQPALHDSVSGNLVGVSEQGDVPQSSSCAQTSQTHCVFLGDFLFFFFFWPGIYVFLVGDSQYCHLILPPVAEGLLLTAHPSHHFN